MRVWNFFKTQTIDLQLIGLSPDICRQIITPFRQVGEQCDYCVSPLLDFLDSRLRQDKGTATKTCGLNDRSSFSHIIHLSVFLALSGAQCKCSSVCSMKVCLSSQTSSFSSRGVSGLLKVSFSNRQSIKYFVLFQSLYPTCIVLIFISNIDSRSQSLQMIYLS